MINARRAVGVAGAAAAALAVTVAATPAQATSAPRPDDKASTSRPDDLPNPLAEAQAKLRKEAVTKLIKGEATTETRGGQRVIKLKGNSKAEKGSRQARDRYVSYPVNREEDIFTVLTDFGTQTKPGFDATPGPVHNQIPAPDRVWEGNATDDNSTNWVPDFSRQHYQDLMFGAGESFKDFYTKLSNGRFLAKGDVSNWVSVPFNEARYGAKNDADGYWNYVKDTATAWYEAQKAAGQTDAQIVTYLKQFDKVDRYDFDGDGNFNEPDGYIDHFQAIHAGEGEEAGGGAQGVNAIWSHRWYAYSTNAGRTGPAGNLLGGVPLGNSGIWIGDYTTEPENGGLGVFAHEFGHDLGLPDLYDTAGGDNGTGFWTLMSAGSWLNDGKDSIGTKPGYMGAWEKLQLGWLDHKTVNYGKTSLVPVGPAARDMKGNSQALVVNLPDKTVTTDYNTPHSGATEWWSGSDDDMSSTLTRTVDLTGKTSASMSAWLQYNVEDGYDYLYVEGSADGGATWTALDTITGPADNEALTDWAQKTWSLNAFAGKNVQVRMRYATDGGVHFEGAFVDDIALTVDGAPVLTDDVESGTNGWTAAGGFTRMSGTTSEQVSHYYIAENRVYQDYDRTLRTGPYNFGWANTKPDWVERFPYQNGLLVSYVDGAYGDNNTSAHPGHGEVLPVDARPAAITFPDGALLGNRRQPWDATFGHEWTDKVTFHRNGVAKTIPSQRPVPVFDDRNPDRYWSAANPQGSVKVAGAGVQITVAATDRSAEQMLVLVTFRK